MSHPRGLILTRKGWRAVYDTKDVPPAQLERDRRIEEWRRATARSSTESGAQ